MDLNYLYQKSDLLISNVEKIIFGKRDTIKLVITAMLSDGHILIEDVPGVGKTGLVASLSASCDGKFGRIQFTPDVMPSDITGFTIINGLDKKSEFRQGAAFCNFLLADEINRASPKSQSALLEIMEEKQVSIDGTTYKLPEPFMVLATQNPIETYGTYHLPEAQMDRFLMRISIGYPDFEDEINILNRNKNLTPSKLEMVISKDDIFSMKDACENVHCEDKLKKYIVNISDKTRNSEFIKMGVSPRGSLSLFRAAKSFAFINKRDFVTPDDIKTLAPSVLSHRIILSSKGQSYYKSAENAITSVISEIEVPI